jgi:peptidoglycan hydrolase CwlO-like protein
MSRELATRIARRALVVAATVAVIGVSTVTVQLAAAWRAQAAPLDAAPVSMTTINDDLNTQVGRATDLSGQVDQVASQLNDLRSAVTGATGAIAGQTTNATTIQQQLDAAKAKLAALQKQLGAAQARLGQLNAAAAKQAAINAAAKRAASSSRAVTTAPTTAPHNDG